MTVLAFPIRGCLVTRFLGALRQGMIALSQYRAIRTQEEFMSNLENVIDERLKNLESHLKHENPVLLNVVQGFRALDRVAYKMGLLGEDESYAAQITWWPLVSVLGVFSAGKSTFINYYLGTDLQRSGNQAVDDKFTVICYSDDKASQTLPGVALDADPRFPFYQFSKEIDQVAEGEGKRINAYLQLKTCPSEKLRGKIVIDSPGFDADSQRTSTLRITDHIIDLSDLVLVFFDARHPEPGAMRDTLKHLVEDTIQRPDSAKFLYILNQIDTTAREDNPEEVIAAWQRALGERGLTAGRFYSIYNPMAAVPINDENLRQRFESKRDADLAEIGSRIQQVEVQRAYRIVDTLEKTARDIEERVVPFLQEQMKRWKRSVLWSDGVLFALIAGGALFWSIRANLWQDFRFEPGRLEATEVIIGIVVIALVGAGIHFLVRRLTARIIVGNVRKKTVDETFRGNVAAALTKTLKPWWRSIFNRKPAGWGRSARKQIRHIVLDTDRYVQTLNDTYTAPSGSGKAARQEPESEPTQPTPTSEAAGEPAHASQDKSPTQAATAPTPTQPPT